MVEKFGHYDIKTNYSEKRGDESFKDQVLDKYYGTVQYLRIQSCYL
jgi:hypothetical protein